MPETTPLIKAALNLRVGAGFAVYLALTVNRFLFSCHNNRPPDLDFIIEDLLANTYLQKNFHRLS